MNKIKQLSPDQAQKIAAGEVVERPANIVKELLENSIDAGANQITLYIEKAGKKLIRILDNGSGMTPEDARLCFLSHATSKITSIDQLESIDSFGFRGEALASISAVSKITLSTKTEESQEGVCIEYSEGKLLNQKAIACPTGTDIHVQDLFYNLPVRQKFLKQDETEWNQIQNLVYAFCLNHRTVFFKLYHDNRMILNAPPVTDLKDRVAQLWDYNIAQQMVQLKQEITNEKLSREKVSCEKVSWISLSGMISQPHFWRYNKNFLYFFVNNRWIKNHELSKALLKGYLNVLPVGKFPAAFIFITLDKKLVDINCHPKKEEVRFIKPHSVEQAISIAVQQSLGNQLTARLAPAQGQEPHHSIQETGQDVVPIQTQSNPFSRTLPQPNPIEYQLPDAYNISETSDTGFEYVQSFGEPFQITTLPQPLTLPTREISFIPDAPLTQSFTIIGQLFNTYILIENNKELLMIDQHAAHERVLYEQLAHRFTAKEGTRLLFPEIITLSQDQIKACMQEQEFFLSQGIEFEPIGPQQLALKATPPRVDQASAKEIILQACDFIQENENLERELFSKKFNEHVHSHLACKSAVKAGDHLTLPEMYKLVQDLLATEKRFICVHGRPTMWTILQEEIEKHFRR